MIPESVIADILNIDIEDVISGEGVTIVRKGGKLWASCPFHKEDTPSMHIWKAKNRYHCFGCNEGGSSIQFIMSLKRMDFVEAVKYLAKKFHIQYEEEQMSPEEREALFKRQSIAKANAEAQKFYARLLDGADGALRYIKSRNWDLDTLKEFGVGYAPGKNCLSDHLLKLGFSIDILAQAGLITLKEDGTYYDFFTERIVFPIYKLGGIIQGFSGRYIGTKQDIPKYKNSPDSILFSKSKSFFGFFQARATIKDTQTAIVVEGNPDVIRLHQIKQTNAVAPLGTATTDEQIKMIADIARTVILIGDSDAAGQKAIHKNAPRWLTAGLNVRIMTLPPRLDEAGEPIRKNGDLVKVDPDEHFGANPNSYKELLSRHTQDYIPWYCEMQMKGVSSQSQKVEIITDVCKLLTDCRDEHLASAYIEEFAKSYKMGKIWHEQFYAAKNAKERATKKKSAEEMLDLEMYGFYIREHCYYGVGSRSKDRPWSNFVLEPIIHIPDEKNAWRIYRIVNIKGQSAIVRFRQNELTSFTEFKTKTESLGNFVWEASQNELTVVKKYLYDGTPLAHEIKQLGWQKKYRFYAWMNGALVNNRFIPFDEYGIVDIDGHKYYLPGASALMSDNDSLNFSSRDMFQYRKTNDISLYEYLRLFVRSFGDNAKVVFCFLVASLFRDIVVSNATKLPILNLFGQKGTGKSECGHAITAFFDNNTQNIVNSTVPAMAESVAERSNAVIHLDEYKNSIDGSRREFIKSLWDGYGRSKMNVDEKKREQTPVDCGIILSGQEMPNIDNAIFSRMLFLSFNQYTHSEQEIANFEEFKSVYSKGLTHLTGELIALRDKFQYHFRSSWELVLADFQKRTGMLDDRVMKNWCIVLAAFRSIEAYIKVPFDYEEVMRVCVANAQIQNSKLDGGSEVQIFWRTLDNLVASNQVFDKVDFFIKQGGGSVSILGDKEKLEMNPQKRYLFLLFSRVASLYAKEGRSSGVNTLPQDSLKHYLMNIPEFLGVAKSQRFRVIESPTGYLSTQERSQKSRVTTALIFDYDACVDKYDIHIDIATGVVEECISEDEKF